MSVVVGCSFFDGVMLASDCRGTIKHRDGSISHSDNVQKLFALTPTTSVGFVGDIELAGIMLRYCISQTWKRNRKDAVSLANWLPRFFRAVYYAKTKHIGFFGQIAFIVASVITDRPNVIEREKVVKIMNRIMKGESPVQRNWLTDVIVNILKTPANVKYVRLIDQPTCLLYVLQPPDFIPQHLMPLDFAAIGSGQEVVIEIDRYHDIIFAGEVGNPFMESLHLTECMRSFIRKQNIETVGGLYPCLKINKDGTKFLGSSSEIPVGGTKVNLEYDRMGRWIQRNLTTGKTIQLLFPWEVYKEDGCFDDLDDALESMRGDNN